MGGLGRHMPGTAFTMGVGALALAGFPLMAGFFAKDVVLEIANTNERWGFYVLGSVGALLSALYIGRLWFLTFAGAPRSGAAEHAHESEPLMVVPLVVLAVGASGRRAVEHRTRKGASLASSNRWWAWSPEGERRDSRLPVFYAIAVGITLAGLALAWWVYGSRPGGLAATP